MPPKSSCRMLSKSYDATGYTAMKQTPRRRYRQFEAAAWPAPYSRTLTLVHDYVSPDTGKFIAGDFGITPSRVSLGEPAARKLYSRRTLLCSTVTLIFHSVLALSELDQIRDVYRLRF
jgi:hypothetical protein